MNILVNGEETSFDDKPELGTLIKSMSLENSRYAVEVNEALIPRSEHAGYELHEGDSVEIVQAIGGG